MSLNVVGSLWRNKIYRRKRPTRPGDRAARYKTETAQKHSRAFQLRAAVLIRENNIISIYKYIVCRLRDVLAGCLNFSNIISSFANRTSETKKCAVGVR